MPLEMFLDFLAVRIDGPRAEGLEIRVDWRIGDDECRRVTLGHGALNHADGSHGDHAEATVTVTRHELARAIVEGKPLAQALDEDDLSVTGDRATLRRLLSLLDTFYPMFNVLEH